MDVDATFKAIQSVFKTVSGKSEGDVSLTYKGTGYGVTKPWIARIEAREVNHEEYDGALLELLAKLKQELADKVKSAESEVTRLRQAYNQLGN
jgi:hypothetical protein